MKHLHTLQTHTDKQVHTDTHKHTYQHQSDGYGRKKRKVYAIRYDEECLYAQKQPGGEGMVPEETTA